MNVVYVDDDIAKQTREAIENTVKKYDHTGVVIIFLIFSITCFLGVLNNTLELVMGESVKPYQERIIQLEEDLDLNELKNKTTLEHVDDKRFKQHQRELRYYDMNLEQSKLMYWLGIIVIAAGFLIILITIFVSKDSVNESVVPMSVGCISGILTDFIGYMFINMYSKNLQASIEYHKKLVISNNLLFFNVVTSRISDSSSVVFDL